MKVVSKIPYRIGLIGGGTDLPYFSNTYGAQIINAAFNAFTYCEITPLESPVIFIESGDYNKQLEIKKDTPFIRTTSQEFRIATAALDVFQTELALIKSGLHIKTYSDFSPQTGLGGSSAHLVATLKALAQFFNKDWSNEELLNTAIFLERNVLTIFGGYQDFFPCIRPGSHYIYKSKDSDIQSKPLNSHFLKSLDLDFYLIPQNPPTKPEEPEDRLPDLDTLKYQFELGKKGAHAWQNNDPALFKNCLIESWQAKKDSGPEFSLQGVLASKTCGLAKSTRVLVTEKNCATFTQQEHFKKILWI